MGTEIHENGRWLAVALTLLLCACGREKIVYRDVPTPTPVVPECLPKPQADAGKDKEIILGLGLSRFVGLGGKSVGKCSWAPADGLDNPESCLPIASPKKTTTYTLTATNVCGSAKDTVVVTVYGE